MDAPAGKACPAMNAAPARLSHTACRERAFRAKMARCCRRTVNLRKTSSSLWGHYHAPNHKRGTNAAENSTENIIIIPLNPHGLTATCLHKSDLGLRAGSHF